MGARSARFGNVVVIAFLITQACDGVLTYIGVSTYGAHMEGNPLLGWLMGSLGCVAGLAAAKAMTGALGIALHLVAVHRVVAALAAFYFVAAVAPWVGLLFF